MLLWLIFGCTTTIQTQYQNRASDVLGQPGPAEEQWEPDLRLRMSKTSLQEIAHAIIDDGLLPEQNDAIRISAPLVPDFELRPNLRVTELEVVNGSTECNNCLDLSVRMGGRSQWEMGPASGEIPLRARAEARVYLSLEEDEDGQWHLSLGEIDLQRLTVSTGSMPGIDFSHLLEDWIEDEARDMPSVSLGSLGGRDVPIRAIRVRSGTHALRVEALTNLNVEEVLPRSRHELESDWEFQISQGTLLALMQRRAFETGPNRLQLAVDPRDFALEQEKFLLDLRLWRLWCLGWWRDYDIEGRIQVLDEELRIEASEIEESGHSRFAGLFDPLAFLAERKILRALDDGIRTIIPLENSAFLDDSELRTRAESLHAQDGVLRVTGNLEITEHED